MSNDSRVVFDELIVNALKVMWNYALNGSIYKASCGLGMFAAVAAVGSWCIKFYKALNEGTLLPVANDMVWPLLVVLLLANNGENLRNATFGARDITRVCRTLTSG